MSHQMSFPLNDDLSNLPVRSISILHSRWPVDSWVAVRATLQESLDISSYLSTAPVRASPSFIEEALVTVMALPYFVVLRYSLM